MNDLTQSEVWKLAEIAMAAQQTYRAECEAAKYEAHKLKMEVENLKAEIGRLALAKYESDAAIDVLTKTIKRLAP